MKLITYSLGRPGGSIGAQGVTRNLPHCPMHNTHLASLVISEEVHSKLCPTHTGLSTWLSSFKTAAHQINAICFMPLHLHPEQIIKTTCLQVGCGLVMLRHSQQVFQSTCMHIQHSTLRVFSNYVYLHTKYFFPTINCYT